MKKSTEEKMQTNLHNVCTVYLWYVWMYVHLCINITFNDRIWIVRAKRNIYPWVIAYPSNIHKFWVIYIFSRFFCSSSSLLTASFFCTWYRVYYIYMNFNSLSCLSNNSYLLSNMELNDVSVRIVMKKKIFFTHIYCIKMKIWVTRSCEKRNSFYHHIISILVLCVWFSKGVD